MQEDEIACFKDEATHGMTSDLRAVIFFRSAVLNLQGHRLRRIGGCGAAAICAPNGTLNVLIVLPTACGRQLLIHMLWFGLGC